MLELLLGLLGGLDFRFTRSPFLWNPLFAAVLTPADALELLRLLLGSQLKVSEPEVFLGRGLRAGRTTSGGGEKCGCNSLASVSLSVAYRDYINSRKFLRLYWLLD